MRFLFVCGGTGGHINPALAVAGKLRELLPDAQFLFVGTGREMEKRLIPTEGFELRNITITGMARGLSPEKLKNNLKMAKNLLVAAKESEMILRDFRPDAVIGTGGYVCYPVLKKAAELKIPTLLHESNAVPGLTTKLLSGRVDRMLVAFPGLEKYYKRPERVVVTGTPVRGGFSGLTREAARAALGIGEMPLVVSFWGSLGASRMNDIMADFIKRNNDERTFYHIHATGGGEAGAEKMRDRLTLRGVVDLGEHIEIRPYIHDMSTVMTAADVVLCRSGASTIAELALKGKPSILVPSPNVTNNHQEKNARVLEKAGGALVLLEEACSGEILYKKVGGMLRDPARLEEMSRCARALGNQKATDRIIEIVLSEINR